jgi:hypothetical protein
MPAATSARTDGELCARLLAAVPVNVEAGRRSCCDLRIQSPLPSGRSPRSRTLTVELGAGRPSFDPGPTSSRGLPSPSRFGRWALSVSAWVVGLYWCRFGRCALSVSVCSPVLVLAWLLLLVPVWSLRSFGVRMLACLRAGLVVALGAGLVIALFRCPHARWPVLVPAYSSAVPHRAGPPASRTAAGARRILLARSLPGTRRWRRLAAGARRARTLVVVSGRGR